MQKLRMTKYLSKNTRYYQIIRKAKSVVLFKGAFSKAEDKNIKTLLT